MSSLFKGTKFEQLESKIVNDINKKRKSINPSFSNQDGDYHNVSREKKQKNEGNSNRKVIKNINNSTNDELGVREKIPKYKKVVNNTNNIDNSKSSQIENQNKKIKTSDSSSDSKSNDNQQKMNKKVQNSNDNSSSKIDPNNPLANDRTVYIQGIPFDSTEEAVTALFRPVGDIVSVRLPRWHDNNNRLKGYGHIEFKSAAAAQAAIDLSGQQYLGDRYLTIDRPLVPRIVSGTGTDTGTKEKPVGCRTVFLKNLPYDVTEEQIKQIFMVCGPIVNIRLAVWAHTNNQKGIGYIDFKREDSAEIAVKKSGTLKVGDRFIITDYETNKPKGSFKDGKNKKNKNK